MYKSKKCLCTLVVVAALLGGTGWLLTDGMPAAVAGQQNERHPHIRKALHELREARRELVTGAHDFGGHRADAVQAVDVAIKQLEIALKYDKH
jgi:hypothetical protein